MPELQAEIFSHLPLGSIHNAILTAKTWKTAIVNSDTLWTMLFKKMIGPLPKSEEETEFASMYTEYTSMYNNFRLNCSHFSYGIEASH